MTHDADIDRFSWKTNMMPYAPVHTAALPVTRPVTRVDTSDSFGNGTSVPQGTTGQRLKAVLLRRSRGLVELIETRIDLAITLWIVFAVAMGVEKVMGAPGRPTGLRHLAIDLLPYLLVALAPVAGYRLTEGSFPSGSLFAQPLFRLARFGRWMDLDAISARRHPAFGSAGILASLAVSILLNVPVRTVEFLTAMPAIDAAAPDWAHTLAHAMAADVIVMNFFYAVCFAMALRNVPLFPRMLIFAWAMDIMMQFVIAKMMGNAPDLPANVRAPLVHLLQGNVDKVLITVLIWMPYLLLSERVNVTFRWRARRVASASR